MRRDYLVVAVLLVIGVSAIALLSFQGMTVKKGKLKGSILPFSLQSVQGERSWMFETGSYCWADKLTSKMSYGRTTIQVKNLEKDEDTRDNVGEVQIGSYRIRIDDGESVNHNGYTVRVVDTKSFGCVSPGSIAYNQWDYDYINSLLWKVKINIPKDKITADVSNMHISGDRANFDVVIDNNWEPFYAGSVAVHAFGQKKPLGSEQIGEGRTRETLTVDNIKKGKKYDVYVSFENVKLVQDKLSGEGDTNGDTMTAELWSSSGGACDIKEIDSARDCTRRVGGNPEPQDTDNWDWKLKDFKSVSSSFYVPEDTDGDGIYNRNDECPKTPGVEKYDGCPSMEQVGGQSILDFLDMIIDAVEDTFS